MSAIPAAHTGPSIAVLPFVNMSKDADNEYFSDGITEEIINALTTIRGLKVIARTSAFAYKGKNIDIRQLGQELNVSSVLEGSVRKAGKRIRITAQLIDTKDGTHYWSRNFDRELEDIFALQDEVSLLIADQVRENFGHISIQEQLIEPSQLDITAYEAYLRGRFHQLRWTPEDLHLALQHYHRATELDPNFARAYYGLMQVYGLLAMWGFLPPEESFERGFAAFLKGQELNTELPEYYMAFVGRFFWKDWDFGPAHLHIQNTLARHPKYMDALEAMAELMLVHGAFTQGEHYVRKALEVDPLSANHYYTLGNNFYMRGDYETALTHLDHAISLNPDLQLAQLLRPKCAIWLADPGRFAAYLPEGELAELLTLLYRAINEPDFVLPKEQSAQWTTTDSIPQRLIPVEVYLLANGGYPERAFELLREYVDKHQGQLINYRVEPFLAGLRAQPGFADLHHSTLSQDTLNLGLPEDDPAAESAKYPANQLRADKERLVTHLEEAAPYLDPGLSLRELAATLGFSANYLSYLINDQLEVNFNTLLNEYRLNRFKALALSPSNAHLTLLALAYDSGFNSKTVFNTYFKKREGLTPRAWLKQQNSG